ncbi:hypothetical protein SAMN05443429_10833 [Cruoricaptor ignavus]|uniref:Uncharacterized protein n=1 Tax=Cruoricaptor ignavus TaxID=1118202 RepID=A0A1M6G2U1_9FLAO|nr:hypothetical protein [Cruoricaptor ignavus]SHJ04283.1 hypothetical protein SAMN05443429_10833 [Cruoricaptor ignavus]
MDKSIEKKQKISMVKLLREIRDKMSLEMMDMTFEEQREYLDKKLEGTMFDKKLREKPQDKTFSPNLQT